MAHDVVELLDAVGWTAEKKVHVVGVSLGGESIVVDQMGKNLVLTNVRNDRAGVVSLFYAI